MFATTLFQSIMEFNLSKNDLIVLFGYCSVLEYGNAINISQQDISDLTGIARPHVARSVKKLKDIGYTSTSHFSLKVTLFIQN